MTERFEMIGEWFLPNNKQNKVHGTLIFEPQQSITLQLYGSLSFCETESIINGITSTNQEITLYRCFKIGESINMSNITGEQKHSPLYMALYLLVGLLALEEKDLVFNKISAQIFNFDEWMSICGFHRKNNPIQIEYKTPNPINFKINDLINRQLVFKIDTDTKEKSFNRIILQQNIMIEIISKGEKGIIELLNYITHFKNFLSMGLYKGTYLVSVSLYRNKLSDEYPCNINLYYISKSFPMKRKPVLYNLMLFSYNDIQNTFPVIIKNWYDKYTLLKPAFDLVFEQFYAKETPITNIFLNLVQAAETFHSRLHNHTQIPKTEYCIMKQEILNIVPQKYHDWLNHQFSFGNELSLHQRLEELIEKYSNDILESLLGNKEQFISNVKHSRNYYTHYSNNRKTHALDGSELYCLSERLKVLLICAFLTEIGFEKNIISSLLEQRSKSLFNDLLNS